VSHPDIQAVLEGRERWAVIQGDCLDVMRGLPDGCVDAVVTDPPYGIGKDGQKRTTGGNGGRKAYAFLGWDSERPKEEARRADDVVH
jgi:DNA modification methylase